MDPCHHCGTDALVAFRDFERLPLVTSDLRPATWQGGLAYCRACGAVQKIIDATWRDAVAATYDSYRPYPQGVAIEQSIFSADGSEAVPRSELVFRKLTGGIALPTEGRWLDIGCGNGTMLRSWGRFLPGWRLHGADVADHYRDPILALPGVDGFHGVDPAAIDVDFDLLTLSHVIEHLLDPAAALGAWRARLKPGGRIVIQVPDLARNPFDLVIMDHATHFTRPTLDQCLARAGFTPDVAGDDWVPGELISVARIGDAGPPPVDRESIPPMAMRVQRRIDWLLAVLEAGRAAAAAPAFGIFGTSVKGTWLNAALGNVAQFFVDEDAARIGRTHMGRPILAAADVPDGATVLVPLSAHVARNVDARLRAQGVRSVLPPFPPQD